MEDYATATRNVPEKRSYVNTDGQSTISSHMLEEMERRAKDPISKMDVNLKRSYHNMRRFVKSATPIAVSNPNTEESQEFVMGQKNLNQDIKIESSVKFDELKGS